jgi:molybdate transport system ATP-binding protein
VPLVVEDVLVRRGGFEVRAGFEVGDGETLALLGPNGAGKSTIVEMLAGVIAPAEGNVRLDGRRIDLAQADRRAVGVVFQDGLLFPHLDVTRNVAFGPRARGMSRRQATARATALLERVAPRVSPHAKPAALSGGERQRVALARAMAADPRLLLLDEPLAAVDVSARADLRTLLRAVIAGFDGPCVLVAHDPVDALTLADRIAILEAGRVVQVGTADQIRRAPASSYAADLVGVNLFRGRLEPAGHGAGSLLPAGGGAITVAWPDSLPRTPLDDVLATLRPADVSLHLALPEGSPRNVLLGEIVEVAIHGERARVRLRSEPPVVAEITLGSVERLGLREGIPAYASFKAVEVGLVTPDTVTPGTLGG